MAAPRFGKTNFKRTIKEAHEDLELVEKLLRRIAENNLTATEHARIIAQLALANSRLSRYISEIEKMGNQLPDTSEEEPLTEKKREQ
jgi:hypothetical protein